jgi:hypothetical protein
MYGTARGTPYGYSLWEFKVYGTGGNPTTPPAMPPDPTFPATRLVWSDEFNGAAGSKPDPAKWTIDAGTGQNNELQYYTTTTTPTWTVPVRWSSRRGGRPPAVASTPRTG